MNRTSVTTSVLLAFATTVTLGVVLAREGRELEPGQRAEGVSVRATSFSPSSPGPRLRLLVPAYFYPSGEGQRFWDALGEAARRVPVTAIMNPASGPGRAGAGPDPRYTAVIKSARGAGVKVIGYVSTDYARRAAEVVNEEADRYRTLYPGIQGIFFDEQSSGAAQGPYYRALYQHVKTRDPDALVVTNPGTSMAAEYLDAPATDVACIFENSHGFDSYQPPDWVTQRRRDQTAALCYNVPDAVGMRHCLDLALNRNLGWIYVTDDGGRNPWDTLPSYWAKEVAAVGAFNHAGQQLEK
jgi:hypothetical protein